MSSETLHSYVESYFGRLRDTLDRIPLERIERIGEILCGPSPHNKQVFVIANGGTAATASHMACDLGKNTIGPNQRRFRILSLTDNTPLLTALANDIGYDHVFSEQLVNLIRPGDVLIVITGSGRSPNILEAMRYSRSRSATVIALLGFDGGPARELADELILVPTDDYGLIEDLHMIFNHVLVGYFRERLEDEEYQPI